MVVQADIESDTPRNSPFSVGMSSSHWNKRESLYSRNHSSNSALGSGSSEMGDSDDETEKGKNDAPLGCRLDRSQPSMAAAYMTMMLAIPSQQHNFDDLSWQAPILRDMAGSTLVALCEGSRVVGVRGDLRRRMTQQGWRLANKQWFYDERHLHDEYHLHSSTDLAKQNLQKQPDLVSMLNQGADIFMTSLAAKFPILSEEDFDASLSLSADEHGTAADMPCLLEVRELEGHDANTPAATRRMLHGSACRGNEECQCEIKQEMLGIFTRHNFSANQPLLFFDGYIHVCRVCRLRYAHMTRNTHTFRLTRQCFASTGMYKHILTHLRLYMYICKHYVYVYVYSFTCIHVHIQTLCICICSLIYVYTYVYSQIHICT